MTYKDRASYGYPPPCTSPHTHTYNGVYTLMHAHIINPRTNIHNHAQGSSQALQRRGSASSCSSEGSLSLGPLLKRERSLVASSSGICVTWLIHMCDMTHSFVWRDSFICGTWRKALYLNTFSNAREASSRHRLVSVWHDSFICVPWRIHMCSMTHSYVWHDSSICVTWLIHVCDMSHAYASHDSLICGAWWEASHSQCLSNVRGASFSGICVVNVRGASTRHFQWRNATFNDATPFSMTQRHFQWRDAISNDATSFRVRGTWSSFRGRDFAQTWEEPRRVIFWYLCYVTRSYVWHDAFIRVTWLFIRVTWLLRLCDMTDSYVWHDSLICGTRREASHADPLLKVR